MKKEITSVERSTFQQRSSHCSFSLSRVSNVSLSRCFLALFLLLSVFKIVSSCNLVKMGYLQLYEFPKKKEKLYKSYNVKKTLQELVNKIVKKELVNTILIFIIE